MSLSVDTWSSTLKLVSLTSVCARHSLIQFKVVHRAHVSKVKLFCIYPEISPYCDKCKGKASLILMYWSCPSLNKYWTEVFQTLSWILKVKLQPNLLFALFGEVHLIPQKLHTLAFVRLLLTHQYKALNQQLWVSFLTTNTDVVEKWLSRMSLVYMFRCRLRCAE